MWLVKIIQKKTAIASFLTINLTMTDIINMARNFQEALYV